MRTPACEAPVFSVPSQTTSETFSLHLKLITPMFGGGPIARKVDPDTPIRAASIRGHLRYWWRATVGTQYSSAAALYKAESALWGSPTRTTSGGDTEGGPGKVSLCVTLTSPGKKASLDTIAPVGNQQQGPRQRYFLAPFQEQKKEQLPAEDGYEGTEFLLTVICPSSDVDSIRRTLRAWIAFGGAGARTRRGCGALNVTQEPEKWLLPGTPKGMQAWFNDLVPHSVQPNKAPQFTTLLDAKIILGSQSNATSAWSKLGAFWADFRKGHKGEAYANGCRWKDYREILVPNQKNLQENKVLSLAKVFLGLPIIYQSFPGGKAPAPYAPKIEAAETGRMASPIILKPIALADGSFRAMVSVLKAPVPTHIRINSIKIEVIMPSPANEPLLQNYSAQNPLEAVSKFAAEYFQSQETYQIGGQG